MSTSVVITIVVVIAVIGLASIVGRLITLRQGMLRAAEEAANVETADLNLGLSTTGPTILHFSATWCGPCAAVRRVVDQVCEQVPGVAHVEVDMDANPEAAKRLSVLSLPTTIIFDSGGHPRYRASGVPSVADLRAALQPLLA
jgi:thiol-disulfide isomerase/thioredoxin